MKQTFKPKVALPVRVSQPPTLPSATLQVQLFWTVLCPLSSLMPPGVCFSFSQWVRTVQ